MKQAPGELPIHVRRNACVRLWVVNCIIAIGVGTNYLTHVPEVDGPKMWLFALPALFSTALILTSAPAALFWLLARWLQRRLSLGITQGVIWTMFQVFLYADTRIFNMFHYHVNGQLWNLVATGGTKDSIHLGWTVWTWISAGLACGVLLQWSFWRRAWSKAVRNYNKGRTAPIGARLTWALLLTPLLFEKALYATADLTRDSQIMQLARIFPLYARVPAQGIAKDVLGLKTDATPRIQINSFELNYPHALPAIPQNGPRPNVLVLVVDCLRQDRMNAKNMPHATSFSKDARMFADHSSAGNATRYGLFAFIYSLYGSYWFSVLEEQTSPVLIDTLIEFNYKFGIFGSASMDYPEMRQTAWSRIQDDLHDEFGEGEPWQKDEAAADAMLAWLQSMEADEEPFFGFILLDAPHQTYSHPPDQTPYLPEADSVDYMQITKNKGLQPEQLQAIINRYNNAVYHSDSVLGRILDGMRASKRYENTIIVITGDHGEEFEECGHFGHTSAFTPEQIKVPFLMRGPGISPGIETRPTSHMDFAPTLLELMGANPIGRDSWALGQNLLSPLVERRRVVSGWNELGILTPEAVLRVPLSLFRFDVEVLDHRWNHLEDDKRILRDEAQTLEDLGAACNRFLRQTEE
jgi:membrane-anchored protein YejM (alkaline phosphatase superfamily)